MWLRRRRPLPRSGVGAHGPSGRGASPTRSSTIRIRALENDLGVELFSRRGRPVELTPADRKFRRHVRTVPALTGRAVRDTRPADPQRLMIITLAAGIDGLSAGLVVSLGRQLSAARVSLTAVSFVDHV